MAGLLSLAGEAGLVLKPVGVAGAVESSTYETGAEQTDVLPAASVVLAVNGVSELSATVTARPGDANVAAVPVAAGVPVQSPAAYTVTVAPAAAPAIFGLLSFAGDAGEVSRPLGAPGAVESST